VNIYINFDNIVLIFLIIIKCVHVNLHRFKYLIINSRHFSNMDHRCCTQLFPHEGQLSHVLLRFKYDIVEGLAYLAHNEPPYVYQYYMGL